MHDWMRYAQCAREHWGPDTFFRGDPRSYSTARHVCRTCPVRLACLAFALKAEDGTSVYYRQGVFGGLSPAERVALAREVA